MITKVGHTAGALRAAEILAVRPRKVDRMVTLKTAEIIDRETAAPEMLEALEALLDIAPLATDEASMNIHRQAEAAIRKAKGE